MIEEYDTKNTIEKDIIELKTERKNRKLYSLHFKIYVKNIVETKKESYLYRVKKNLITRFCSIVKQCKQKLKCP